MFVTQTLPLTWVVLPDPATKLLPAPSPVLALPARTATGETDRLARRLHDLLEPYHADFIVERRSWGSQLIIGGRVLRHIIECTPQGVAVKDPLKRTADHYATSQRFADLEALAHSVREAISQDETQRLKADLHAEFSRVRRQRLLAVHKPVGVTEIRIATPLQVPWVVQVDGAYVTFKEYVPLHEQHKRESRWLKRYAIRCPQPAALQPFLDAVVAEQNAQHFPIDEPVHQTDRYSIPVLSDLDPPPAPAGFQRRPAGSWPGTNYRLWVYERISTATV
jgi:hypothetical protein